MGKREVADLAGTLAELRPVLLLRFLAGSAATGTLDVEGAQHRVTLRLRQGVAMAAVCDGADVSTVEGMAQVLRTPSGSFAFAHGEHDGADEAEAPMAQLLEQAAERSSAWELLSQAVPSTSLAVVLLGQAPGCEVQVTTEAWAVVVAVAGGHRTVAAVARHLGWSDFRACAAIKQLVDGGYAGLEAVPRRARTRTGAEVGGGVAAATGRWPGDGLGEGGRWADQWAHPASSVASGRAGRGT